MNKVIASSFQALYGHSCWGLDFKHSLLSLNFGKPSLRVREPFKTNSKYEAVRRIAARRSVTVRGEWWLWMYCCYWRLASEGHPLPQRPTVVRREPPL